MENKQITAVLIMDLLAAFDTVDHDVLLNVLHRKFGIIKTALQWYNNFLKLRNPEYASMAHIHQNTSWTLAYPKDPLRMHTCSISIHQHTSRLYKTH